MTRLGCENVNPSRYDLCLILDNKIELLFWNILCWTNNHSYIYSIQHNRYNILCRAACTIEDTHLRDVISQMLVTVHIKRAHESMKMSKSVAGWLSPNLRYITRWHNEKQNHERGYCFHRQSAWLVRRASEALSKFTKNWCNLSDMSSSGTVLKIIYPKHL